jgi:hypothetical protein
MSPPPRSEGSVRRPTRAKLHSQASVCLFLTSAGLSGLHRRKMNFRDAVERWFPLRRAEYSGRHNLCCPGEFLDGYRHMVPVVNGFESFLLSDAAKSHVASWIRYRSCQDSLTKLNYRNESCGFRVPQLTSQLKLECSDAVKTSLFRDGIGFVHVK